ncbi:hypothetical protein GGH95_000794 [Coemansia sp. RSA 1836]|nr:hypothetical protein GGH95_000794 [Coemansia sp. RSA 1836]
MDRSKSQKWYSFMFKSENRKDSSIVPKDKQATEHSNDKSQLTAATCTFGQLTDVGCQSLTALGTHMQVLYVDVLGFLPAVPCLGDSKGPTEDLYLHTTAYSCTFELLQQVLGSMYLNVPANSPLFHINVWPANHKSLYPDFQNKIFEQLHIDSTIKSIAIFADKYAALHEDVAQIPSLHDEVEPEPNCRAAHASLLVWDTVSSMLAHGLLLPKEIDDEFIMQVSHMSAVKYMYPVTQSTELAKLQLGLLVHELADNVVNAAEADHGVMASKQQLPKMTIYSGHNTTIGPLLAILGNELGGLPLLKSSIGPMWLPFTSSLCIELLKDSASPYLAVQLSWTGDLANYSNDMSTILPEERACLPNVPNRFYHWAPGQAAAASAIPFNPRATCNYYMHVWYNDCSVQLPACLNPGAHHSKLGSTVCTLNGFFKQIAYFMPSDDEVIQECPL